MATFPDAFSLAGQTAIVTGGAMGIGHSILIALAEAGANVVALDQNEDGAKAAAGVAELTGTKALALTADITDKTSVDMAVAEVQQVFGRIDVLVNSAGVTRRFPAVNFPPEEWDRIIKINLTGSFLCCQAVAPHMIKASRGRIINLASIGGMAGYPDSIAYLSSKGGVVQMTRGLAAEWGKHGITVNAIAPGVVMTPMQEKLRKENPAKFDSFLSKMAIQVPAQPEDIAAAALYLASAGAGLVTGHVLPVDGGYLAL